MFRSRLASVVCLACASAVAGCSGGGSSSPPAPQPTPTLGGSGGTFTLNQSVNFTVVVPPASTSLAIGAIVKKRLAAPAVTNPYVSPNTGSVVLQLGSVNGVSFAQAPPPVPAVNIPCGGSAAGCSVPVQNVKAAKGIDRFAVETFSGPSGTGNLISTGYIDVAVPSAQSSSFGGTSLTIGGYTASISLALNPPVPFTLGTPGTGNVDVIAVDPAGAIIIGNSYLASPIAVVLGGNGAVDFTLNNGNPVSLQYSLQSLPLGYDGRATAGGQISASTVDETGASVVATLPIPVATVPPTPAPPPTPVPTATATHPGATPTPFVTPLSIYVYDASSDNIVEYDKVRSIEGGNPPNPAETPRRAFAFAVNPNTYPNCSVFVGANITSPDLGGIAVASNGTIYAQSKCTDAAMAQAYTFAYPATTQQLSTPPPAAVAFAAPLQNAGSAAQPYGIKIDTVHNQAYVGYTDASFSQLNLVGFALGSTAPSANIAANCISELGQSSDCASGGNAFAGPPATNFSLDGAGYAYVGAYYPDQPPGSASQHNPGDEAIVTLPTSAANPAPYPFSVLSGFADDLGGQDAAPPVDAIEGTTLYALANPGAYVFFDSSGNVVNTFLTGLSNCTVPPDPLDNGNVLAGCPSDTQYHTYLVGFRAATSALSSVTNAGQNLVSAPAFELGGDAVTGGGFGTSTYGDILTVVDGFAYVANGVPNVNSPTSPPYAAEIDVYDVRSVTGASVSTAPVARIVLPTSVYPTAITIGPTGSGTGGLQILAKRSRPHHNIRAMLQRYKLQLQRHRRNVRSR